MNRDREPSFGIVCVPARHMASTERPFGMWSTVVGDIMGLSSASFKRSHLNQIVCV